MSKILFAREGFNLLKSVVGSGNSTYKKHQAGLGAMVNSYHIPNALTEEDLPVEINREGKAFLK